MSFKERILGLFKKELVEDRAGKIALNETVRSQLINDLQIEAGRNQPAAERINKHLIDRTIAVHSMEDPHKQEEDTIFGEIVEQGRNEAKMVLLVDPDQYSTLPDQKRIMVVGKIARIMIRRLNDLESRGKSLVFNDPLETYQLVRRRRGKISTTSLSSLMKV